MQWMASLLAHRDVTELSLPTLLAVALQGALAGPEQAPGEGVAGGAVGAVPTRVATLWTKYKIGKRVFG